MPAGWFETAKEAATSGLNTAMLVAAVCTLVLASLSAVVLRHVGVIGGEEPREDGGAGKTDPAELRGEFHYRQ